MPLNLAEKQRELPVDEQGWILLGEQALSQREAAVLAYGLIDAIDRSINRSQPRNGAYTKTQAILVRMETPIYKAKSAIADLF